ncbi:MAG: HlyD family type I secretion periplasmic adaptor subunit [Psychromonas sp.]|nr:HlyD family type I secretion periplasmic adaptor subunit [Psychromonas sp.]
MNDRDLANKNWPEYEFTDVIEAPIERKLLRNITFFIVASIAVLILWSIFTRVEEVAKAMGNVIPLGHRQIIQSKLGGTIESVLVQEGDTVKKGQVLVHFISTNSRSEVNGLKSEQADLLLQIERLSAFINHRRPDFHRFEAKYPQLVIQNHRSLDDMNREYDAIKKSSLSEIAKVKAELKSVQHVIPTLRRQVNSSKKTVDMMDKLVKTGAVSKIKRLEEIQKNALHVRELEQMRGKKYVLLETFNNLNDQYKQKEASLLKVIGQEQTDTQAELLKVQSRLVGSNSTMSQNTIISPVDGLVQSIPSTSAGSVILQGGTVAVIVPTTKTALLEAKITPRDIGFVTLGESAKVKVDAFDYSRYGALNGIVKRISPTTETDEHGAVFYKVAISIAKPYFGNDPTKFNLIPGMTGEADIVTGEKTVFQYLWKPVFTNIANAFGER